MSGSEHKFTVHQTLDFFVVSKAQAERTIGKKLVSSGRAFLSFHGTSCLEGKAVKKAVDAAFDSLDIPADVGSREDIQVSGGKPLTNRIVFKSAIKGAVFMESVLHLLKEAAASVKQS